MYYSIVILKHFWSVNIKVTRTWLSHCPLYTVSSRHVLNSITNRFKLNGINSNNHSIPTFSHIMLHNRT